jgi:hypothetical protein
VRRTSAREYAVMKSALSSESFSTGSSVLSKASSGVAFRTSAITTLTGSFGGAGGSGRKYHQPALDSASTPAATPARRATPHVRHAGICVPSSSSRSSARCSSAEVA